MTLNVNNQKVSHFTTIHPTLETLFAVHGMAGAVITLFRPGCGVSAFLFVYLYEGINIFDKMFVIYLYLFCYWYSTMYTNLNLQKRLRYSSKLKVYLHILWFQIWFQSKFLSNDPTSCEVGLPGTALYTLLKKIKGTLKSHIGSQWTKYSSWKFSLIYIV